MFRCGFRKKTYQNIKASLLTTATIKNMHYNYNCCKIAEYKAKQMINNGDFLPYQQLNYFLHAEIKR